MARSMLVRTVGMKLFRFAITIAVVVIVIGVLLRGGNLSSLHIIRHFESKVGWIDALFGNRIV